MALSGEKINNLLKNKAAVHIYGSIDSTNSEARRRAKTDRGVHLYVAEKQTAGRGRLGRSFYSPKDTGLYMTLALPMKEGGISQIQTVTCAAAVAVCRAIESLSDKKPLIKWVNDIYIGGRKVAGILAELICAEGYSASAVIIGIGVNLTTESFPADIAQTAGSIGDIDREALCAGIAGRLTEYYEAPRDASVMDEYARRNLCIGREVTFTRNGIEKTAEAVGIDSGGGLIVSIDGKTETLNSGEISVRLDSD